MRTLTLALTLTLAASGVAAQEWNAEQQSLIDHVRMCWDGWVVALSDETPDRWLEVCPIDERSHFWWTDDGAPGDLETVRRGWHIIRTTDDDWASLRPIYVDIFGDVGIIHMYGYWRANTPDGTVVTEFKRTEVFQRRDGQWVFIGAQGTPVSASDAEPYRR
jgi:hypothetical protein